MESSDLSGFLEVTQAVPDWGDLSGSGFLAPGHSTASSCISDSQSHLTGAQETVAYLQTDWPVNTTIHLWNVWSLQVVTQEPLWQRIGLVGGVTDVKLLCSLRPHSSHRMAGKRRVFAVLPLLLPFLHDICDCLRFLSPLAVSCTPGWP